jgi:Kef-type K+ transport system membrane component KefB
MARVKSEGKMDATFLGLAVILFAAFIVSYLVRTLNQPLIIGYIIAGIIISPILVSIGASTSTINLFSELGISFLLFIVGLSLNPKVIKEIGGASLFIGFGQMVLTFIATYLVSGSLMHADMITSVYYGIAVSFSSTIIVLKLLSDKREIDSLSSKISIGILIVQDIAAAAVLIFISSMSGMSGSGTWEAFIGGGILIILLLIGGYFALPRIMKKIAKSQELLFLFSIGWCFVLAALFSYIGFSMEIGSLLAGIILSTSPYATEISSKIRPLRDFFLIIFFIILGLSLQISEIQLILIPAIILSGISLIFKPVILMVFGRFFSYTRRTNFLVGSALSQISEFSLIVGALGLSMGQISRLTFDTIILTLLITIFLSSYFITYSGDIYNKLSGALSIFENKKAKRSVHLRRDYNTVLFGYNRIGFSILNALKRMKRKYIVVDFNPDTIAKLNKFGIPALYGDVYDKDFLDDLKLKDLSLVISTIPEVETNELIIETVREVNKDAIIILRAHTVEDAMRLYDHGANYVLTPHFLGGEFVARMIKHEKAGDQDYGEERKKHIKMLKEIVEQIGDHPMIEKN